MQKKKEEISQMRWHMAVIPTFVRQAGESGIQSLRRIQVCISEHGPRGRALSHTQQKGEAASKKSGL